MNQIGALAFALKEMAEPKYKEYCDQVMANTHAFVDGMKAKGYKLRGDGTINHMLLWQTTPNGLSGAQVEKILDRVWIFVTNPFLPGDTLGKKSGIRIGTPAITT